MRRQGNPGAWGSPAVVLILLLFFAPAAFAAEPERGFQAERRVHTATRLDWEFAAGPEAGRLPAGYDSRQQRYQLFVPTTYKATKSWPLVLFVSPGDDPLGWRAWKKPCEDNDWLFAAPYAAGNGRPLAQRIRAVLDILDDVQQNYQIDPARTYLAGFSGGAVVAARIAFALPEHFGGIIDLSGDADLPELEHLRRQAAERLSVALVVGKDDRQRKQVEKYLAPLFGDLGIRSRLWVVGARGHELPPAPVLVLVQRWLEDDLKRRLTDPDRLTPGKTTRRELAEQALARARKEIADPARGFAGVARLRWLVARWGKTEAGEKAAELLTAMRADARWRNALASHTAASQRRLLTAQARALESVGRLEESRNAWDKVVLLAEDDERKKAVEASKRLTGLLARTAWLGVTFAGDTSIIQAVAPGGPAQRAGMQAGDRLEKMGKIKVAGPDDVREQLRSAKPGDNLRLILRRKGKELLIDVKVGSPPPREE